MNPGSNAMKDAADAAAEQTQQRRTAEAENEVAERALQIRMTALGGALRTNGPGADASHVVKDARLYAAFLTGETQ